MYSTIKLVNLLSQPKRLGTTNLCYESSISSRSNKELAYVVLKSNLEDTCVSFLHVHALCLVVPKFLQRYRVSKAVL
jgi:hypothetical protein